MIGNSKNVSLPLFALYQSTRSYRSILEKALGQKTFEQEDMISMDQIDEVYAQPKKIEPTHRIPICQVQFQAYSLHRIDFYMDFCRRAAHSMNLPCTGTIRLPVHIKRWTVLKSPFVHKAAMEVFERRTHKRLLQIYDADLEVAKKWIEYIETNIPGGIGMKSRIFEYESLDFLDSFKVSQSEIENGTQIKATSSPDAHQVKAMADLVVKKLSENPKLSIDKVTKDVIEQFRSTPKK